MSVRYPENRLTALTRPLEYFMNHWGFDVNDNDTVWHPRVDVSETETGYEKMISISRWKTATWPSAVKENMKRKAKRKTTGVSRGHTVNSSVHSICLMKSNPMKSKPITKTVFWKWKFRKLKNSCRNRLPSINLPINAAWNRPPDPIRTGGLLLWE